MIKSVSLAWVLALGIGVLQPISTAIANPQFDFPLAELSLPQAVEKVRQKQGGRVLSATRFELNGRPCYRIKLLQSNGRVITVIVDAENGAILGG